MNIKSVAIQYWRSHARGLRVVAVVLLALLVLLALAGWADRRYPLPAAPHFSTVVLDRQGEPLRAFADEQGSGVTRSRWMRCRRNTCNY